MALQQALQVFETEDHQPFRTIMIDGAPWFVLTDVCRALDHGNPSQAASRLDDDEKGIINSDTLGGAQKMVVVSESGLYSLILTSRKEGAKRFKKWVTSEVLPSIRKTGGYGQRVPAFIRRANDNFMRVDAGYFSVINELAVRLYGRLEMVGYVLADRARNGAELRPDVSVGRHFSDWLKANHPAHAETVSYYQHVTPQWEGPAKQYPLAVLPLFIQYVDTVWVLEHAEAYFKPRDPAALAYLPRILPSADAPRPGMMKEPAWRKLSRR